MRILDRLPFAEEQTSVLTPDGVAVVKPFQIIVWVSLATPDDRTLPPGTPRFPAILDTGNNHNFAIRHEQLERWSRLTLLRRGQVSFNDQIVPLLAAHLWIHPNVRGIAELSAREPFRLQLPEGIAVYPPDVSNPARLPILGLRGLVQNNLLLTISGRSRHVSLWRRRAPDDRLPGRESRMGASPSVPMSPSLVLINAVGLTGRLLPLAPRLKALAEAGWSPAAARGRARRHLHRAGEPADGPAPRRPRRRRQRLAVPRHRRGPVLAAVERA